MTTAVFDTLKVSRNLKAAGFAEAQADAIVQSMAEAFEDTVATKSDVVAIRADMDKLEASVKADIAAVKAELKDKSTKTDLAVIRGDIRLLKWMIGVILACVAFPILKSFLV